MTKCLCGCGKETKAGRRYINHHNFRTIPKEQRKLCPLNGFQECLYQRCGFFESHKYNCGILSINNLSVSVFSMKKALEELKQAIEDKMLL